MKSLMDAAWSTRGLSENNAAAGSTTCNVNPPQMERRVRKLLQLVESGTTFEIEELAAAIHISEAHLQRLFRHDTGFYLGQWLREQRLERSAYLLISTSLSVKQIAHTVGYEHASSFTRAFERQFLQPPAHLRKQVKLTDEIVKAGKQSVLVRYRITNNQY